MTAGKHILVLGGARSGKSAYGEDLAENHKGTCVYIATAEPRDDEMRTRIAAHINRRGDNWQTIEAPIEIAEAISRASRASSFVLVDCVTLWLTNVILAEKPVGEALESLLYAVKGSPSTLVLVSNEVGLGIVPENALARHFRDEAGRANQRLAEVCDEVVFIAAGLPLRLKP